jgi:hypothetical protein
VFKKFITLFIITTFVLVLSACGKKTPDNTEKEGVAYGITHTDYVGVATVKVKAEQVTDASFNEYYLPNTWAKLKTVEAEEVPADVVADGATWYGKYLVIGDRHFTGELRDEPLKIGEKTYTKQTVKYSAEDIDDLYVWLTEKEENRKWYVEELVAGNAYVATSDFEKSELEADAPVTSEGELGFTKLETNYWHGENFPLGWQGNMAEIVKAIKGTKMNATVDTIEKGEDNKWRIDGVVSGATLADFKDYYLLAQTAYNKALAA